MCWNRWRCLQFIIREVCEYCWLCLCKYRDHCLVLFSRARAIFLLWWWCFWHEVAIDLRVLILHFDLRESRILGLKRREMRSMPSEEECVYCGLVLHHSYIATGWDSSPLVEGMYYTTKPLQVILESVFLPTTSFPRTLTSHCKP